MLEGSKMTNEFRRVWLHDESRGARYLPVVARSGEEAQHLVRLTALIPPRVIDTNTTTRLRNASRAYVDVSAGWAQLSRDLHRAVLDPTMSDLMIGVDLGDVGVASIGLDPHPRAVWTSRIGDSGGAYIRGLMDMLGWKAVNEHIPVSDAVYGELDFDGTRVPWTESVNAAIELAVLLVPDVEAVIRLFTREDESSVRQIGPDYPLAATTIRGEWPWMSHDASARSAHRDELHAAWFSQANTQTRLANEVLSAIERTTGVDSRDLMAEHIELLPTRPPWLQHGDLFQKTAWWHLAAILGRSMLSSEEFVRGDYDALTSLWRRFVGRVSADDPDMLDSVEPSLSEVPGSISPRAAIDDSLEPVYSVGISADEIIGHRQADTFGQLFAHIPSTRTLESLHLSARVHNRLVHDGASTFADLAPSTVGEVLGWGGIGIGSVRESLRSLLLVPNDTVEPAAGVDAVATNGGPSSAEKWRELALHDVEVLARWHRLLGADDASIFSVPEGLTEPPAIISARERLGQLAANRILPAPNGNGLASELLENLLADFDDRDIEILRRRAFAEMPATLDALGADLAITREYVRQREARAKARLTDGLANDELTAIAGVIRAAIVDVMPLRVLLQQYPSFAEIVDSVDSPLWRVLDRLDDSYEVREGWAAKPSVTDAVARTKHLLNRHAGGRAFVEIAAIDEATASLVDEWLDYCGVKRLLGYALVGGAGIADRAAVVLSDAEVPLTAVDIHAGLGVERSLNAVKNALAVDERFTRVGVDSWALHEWGLRGYQSIKKSIGQLVDASGDGVALATLIEVITARVDVSPNSIVTYAAAHPFITQAGIVRRRTRREMRHPERRKGLAQTRGLYRLAKSVAYRLTITAEHTRGSGTPLPSALGEELDLLQAEKRDVPVRAGGTVTLSWRGPQIAIGSIRSEVQHLGLAIGDSAFLVFHSDGSLDVTALQAASDELSQVAALTGGPTKGDVLEALADRIDSDASSIVELAHAFAARGEHHLADLLGRSSEPIGGAVELRVVDASTYESALDGEPSAGASDLSSTADSLRDIFSHLLREVDVWTAQTYRTGAEFSPYVQGLREHEGGFACELSSNTYLSPPLDDRQLEALRFLGWSDPDPAEGLPNHLQVFSSAVPIERIAEILTKTLLDAVALRSDDHIEFGPHSPELDAYVARRLARE